MIEEPFASGESVIHSLDPRFRVFFAIIYSLVVALCNDFVALAFALIVSLILVVLAKLSFWEVLKRLKPLFVFIILIFIVLSLTYEGEMIYQMKWLRFSRPGVMLALRIFFKSTSILLVFMAFVATMTVATLGRSLKRLYFPEKLVQLLLFSYRYIYVIEHEYKRLFTAIKVRGFRAGTNMHTYKTYAYLIGMLFVRASKRAERVHQAMLCRGFRGRFYSLENFQSSKKNMVFSVLMVTIIFCFILLENRYLWTILPQ